MELINYFYIWLLGFIITWVGGKKWIRKGDPCVDYIELFAWMWFCIGWPLSIIIILMGELWILIKESKPPKFL